MGAAAGWEVDHCIRQVNGGGLPMIDCRVSILCLSAVFAVPQHSLAQEAPFVRDVFQQINKQRSNSRLRPCTYNKKLEVAAQFHAEWMARNRKMEHLEEQATTFEQQKTCNHHPINRAIKSKYLAWDDVFRADTNATGAVVHPKDGANDRIGEIIAAGWNAGHPVTQTNTIVTGWMNSPGHRKEILTKHYKEMGIGVACTPDAKDTFWCVMFGDPIK